MPREGSAAKAGEKDAHKAEQVATPENKNPMLAMFRAESLPTWAEYIRVNRAYDDDEDPNARDVANDLDQLSLTRDGETAVSRVRFDLDLPSAAEDDAPVGPGIPLPEWDYRKSLLIPRHCLLRPMIASDAGHAALPEELAATARKLRGQFAALAPQPVTGGAILHEQVLTLAGAGHFGLGAARKADQECQCGELQSGHVVVLCHSF